MEAIRDNWQLLYALASAATAALLVVAFRFDERFRWFNDEFRFHRPIAARIAAVVKLGVGLALSSLFLSVICIFVWNRFAEQQGRAVIPDFFPDYPPMFFKLAIAWNLPLFLVLALRCRRRALFDVFLSYKNYPGDTELVRRIADQLIGGGQRVWFAEYEILRLPARAPENHSKESPNHRPDSVTAGVGGEVETTKKAGREDRIIERFLDRGARESEWGLAFTNNLYVESDWCRIEMDRLLARRGPKRLLEVQIPREDLPRRKYNQLVASPALESRSVGEIIDFLGAHTGLARGLRERNVDASSLDRWEGHWMGSSVSLDVTGWELHEPPREGGLGGVTFRYPALQPPIFVNIWAHPETSKPGQRADKSINDREMFDYLKWYARKHLRQIPAMNVKLRGIHLLFHSNLSQIGLTYWSDHYWVRKISLVIPKPSQVKPGGEGLRQGSTSARTAAREMAEFEFTFGFVGSFADYCLHSSLMDRLALSLEWR